MRLLLLFVLALPTIIAHAQGTEDPDSYIGLGFYFVTDIDGRTVVTAVAESGAASAAGLLPGDILLTIDGIDVPLVTGVFDMLTVARETPPVLATVEREEETVALELGVGPYNGTLLERAAHDYLCQSGDCWNGEGVWQHPDGRSYVGRFEGGAREGYGIFTWANGGVYEGGHEINLFSGYGMYTWPNGWSWRGQWEFGRGFDGAYYTPDGLFHVQAVFDDLYEPDQE